MKNLTPEERKREMLLLLPLLVLPLLGLGFYGLGGGKDDATKQLAVSGQFKLTHKIKGCYWHS